MAALAERLHAAMTDARRSRDSARTLLFSTILSDLKNRELELHRALTDDETVEVLRRGIKQRREATEQYARGGRPELAQRELTEIQLLEPFLPAAVPVEEIRAAVRAVIAGGAATLGQVMGQVMPRLQGRADGKLVNQIVREELASVP